VHDAHAQLAPPRAVVDEIGKPRPGLGDRHAMQIDLRLHAEAAACKPAHGTTTDGRAVVSQGLGIGTFDGVDVGLQAFAHHLLLVGPREPGLRFRLAGLGLDPVDAPDRLGVRYFATEKIGVIFTQRSIPRLWCAVNIQYSERVPSRQMSERKSRRMKILVSNDDGYLATGINVLSDALRRIADVVVVAPDRNRSAASNSLTLNDPLRIWEVGENRYCVNGTPSDCVHLALTGFLAEEPDLVVSGINHGANLGDDVIYSGTVAAAMEGRFLGLPTIAVSLVGHHLQHFDTAARVAAELVQRLEKNALPSEFIFNVNVPDRPYDDLNGITVARLGFRHKSEPVVKDTDPHGRTIYWVGPAGKGQDAGAGTDFHAIDQGAVSLTPLKVDLTRHEALTRVAEWLQGD
jgi:5'/3'-nucleotidase